MACPPLSYHITVPATDTHYFTAEYGIYQTLTEYLQREFVDALARYDGRTKAAYSGRILRMARLP